MKYWSNSEILYKNFRFADTGLEFANTMYILAQYTDRPYKATQLPYISNKGSNNHNK